MSGSPSQKTIDLYLRMYTEAKLQFEITPPSMKLRKQALKDIRRDLALEMTALGCPDRVLLQADERVMTALDEAREHYSPIALYRENALIQDLDSYFKKEKR